jgi:hypothetical protein
MAPLGDQIVRGLTVAVTVGATVSFLTVTVKEPEVEFPAGSVAVQPTVVVVPTANVAPDACVHAGVSVPPTASDADAA